MLAKNLAIFCPCPETLWEANFQDNRLIHLMEETSRHPSIQAVACIVHGYFSQVYSENCKQKAEQKHLETCSLVRKASIKLGLRRHGFRRD
jgi:hypothetical protein